MKAFEDGTYDHDQNIHEIIEKIKGLEEWQRNYEQSKKTWSRIVLRD